MSLLYIREALETALAEMPGIIPAAQIVSSDGTTFKTSAAHGLVTGLPVTISGHSTTTANGSYTVDVTGDKTFTINDLLTGEPITGRSGTGGTVLANLIAWENLAFPAIGQVPYQKVNLMPGRPVNVTMGHGYYREQGILQVMLVYPIQLGTGDAVARAELIRSTFPRGSAFSKGGIVVNIDSTPEIVTGTISQSVYMLPVRIRYWANIFS